MASCPPEPSQPPTISPLPASLALQADYWAIAMGSCALRCAVLQPARPAGGGSGSGSGLQRVCTLASLAVMPFAPSKVSSANFAVVEVSTGVHAFCRIRLAEVQAGGCIGMHACAPSAFSNAMLTHVCA